MLYFVLGLGDEKDRLYGGTADASRHSFQALVCDALAAVVGGGVNEHELSASCT